MHGSLFLSLAVLGGIVVRAGAAAPLPPLHADGRRMLDTSGSPVTLRGCNLGNWLMIEPWMLRNLIDVQDQGQLTDILRRRFGDKRGTQLMDLYRESYITPRDFALIKSFGFNLVRVPFDYRLLRDESPPYAMRSALRVLATTTQRRRREPSDIAAMLSAARQHLREE